MGSRQLSKEIPGLVLTGARYLLAENMAHRVKERKPIYAQMATFVIADILDGVILRKFNADTPLRRVADGVVDHMSIARVSYEIGKVNPVAAPYIATLAARASAVGALNGLHLLKTGEVTKGQNNQKATNLATAAFMSMSAGGNETLTHTSGGIMSTIGLATVPAHLRGLGQQHEGGIRKL